MSKQSFLGVIGPQLYKDIVSKDSVSVSLEKFYN